jgi:uncharacterized caspase-like protein
VRRKIVRGLTVGLIGGLVGRLQAASSDRLALVVGNADYKFEPLRNPVNDSRGVAASLRGLGFEVLERENVNQRGLITALQEFSMHARHRQVRLLFYAGHGIQIKGRNYLIPVDAELAGEDDVTRTSADVGDLLDRLADLRTGINIVVLDACRSNPYNSTPTLDASGRRIRTRAPKIGFGFVQLEAPRGTIIAYSTAPGAVALDRGEEKNSVFSKHLIANLTRPGQTVEQLFKRVRIAVAAETQNQQIPWESNSLLGEFCFRADAANQCGT